MINHTGFGERLLLALSRTPGTPDYPITTSQYTLGNALDFVKTMLPGLKQTVFDKTILDFGCGPGWQAVAIYKEWGARQVVGIDINDNWLACGQALAQRESCNESVIFAHEIPQQFNGNFDVAMSIGSFEHFGDPASILDGLTKAIKPGGRVVVTFAEPWYSHSGSHMSFFTRVPWVNLWFSEKTVMSVRSRFRDDGATRYHEVEGGLNQMTLRKFEAIVKSSGLSVEYLKFHTTKGLPFVDKIPGLREFFVSAVACILRRPDDHAK